MIEGVVNAALEATVVLGVRAPDGRPLVIEAVIDTGFDGFLTLPHSRVSELGLPYRTRGSATLGNGAEDYFDVYDAEVIWDDQIIDVFADEAETAPLVGMALLEGRQLQIDVRDGGRVLIETSAA